jgi:hypothetical protein
MAKLRRVEHIARVAIAAASTILLSGCILGYWGYQAQGGGKDSARGEQQTFDFAAADAVNYTRDVLRSEGVLFDTKPDNKIVTRTHDADTSASLIGSAFGVHPEYHYEIEVVPESPRRSTIIVNLVTSDIAETELEKYRPSAKLDLFAKITQMAAQEPPTENTPRSGGVNFALLPKEDLAALAKRATGNSDNWKQIAQDNGLKSATDLGGVKSVWVRNSMIPAPASPPP